MSRNLTLAIVLVAIVALIVWQGMALWQHTPKPVEHEHIPPVVEQSTAGTNEKKDDIKTSAAIPELLVTQASPTPTPTLTDTVADPANTMAPVLLPGDHDHLPLLRPELSQSQAMEAIYDAWLLARSIRPGEPLFEFQTIITRRMIGEFLGRWPVHEQRTNPLEIRLLAGSRLPGIDRGTELWDWAKAAAIDRRLRADDLVAALDIAREHIRRVRNERQEDIALEMSAQLRKAVSGTAAEAALLLESGMALFESKEFNQARDAFAKAAKLGSGRVRRDALTWLLAVANQFMWQGDMFDAADGLLADPELTREERARALFSRAHALLLLSEPEKCLRDTREIMANFFDTHYASQAKDLVQQAEAKLKAGKGDKKQDQGVTLTPAAPPDF